MHFGRRYDDATDDGWGDGGDRYVAGSYAEGPYETTLPVMPTVLRAVTPEYRRALVVR